MDEISTGYADNPDQKTSINSSEEYAPNHQLILSQSEDSGNVDQIEAKPNVFHLDKTDAGLTSASQSCEQFLDNQEPELAAHDCTIDVDRVSCSVCPEMFASQSDMVARMSMQHGDTDVKPYACHLCHRSFLRANLLNIHQRTHTGERPFQCEFCGRRFTVRSDLNKHHRLHVDGYLYKCKLCGKEIKTSRESSDHKRMHEGGIVCQICGKQFTRQLNMQAHMRGTHGGERNFQCADCGKSFIYSQNLRHHRRTQHVAPRTHKCSVCHANLATIEELRIHVAENHPDSGPSPESHYQLMYLVDQLDPDEDDDVANNLVVTVMSDIALVQSTSAV